jgi:hypothetical protein
MPITSPCDSVTVSEGQALKVGLNRRSMSILQRGGGGGGGRGFSKKT